VPSGGCLLCLIADDWPLTTDALRLRYGFCVLQRLPSHSSPHFRTWAAATAAYAPRWASLYARRIELMRVWYPLPWWRNQSSTSASMRSVTWALRPTGFSPFRTSPLANTAGGTSGISERSIASPLRDFCEVAFLLIFCCLPYRDEPDRVATLRMRHRDDAAPLRIHLRLSNACL